ncbi:MAG: DUF2268 domain-containing putative Zn-dependent protease [Crocinitomicaceae bacterium]|nr:DUF2268 domain-containing putative Zn-dependent protease [Crocinitomicaceae bacterium]MDG1776438.1 DUF2268 domain-containing putative Zn-dependent protease [Crocinitomicaceae bacterium]
MNLKNSFIAILILTLINSCDRNRLDIDASQVKVDIGYTDMDEVIFKSDSIRLMNKHQEFKKELQEIYDYQVGFCLKIGNVSDSMFYTSIQEYRKDRYIQELESEIQRCFADKSKYEEIIRDGFRHLKFHLPNKKQPKNIVFFNSLFRSGVFCTENEIGIGMDWFLGDSNRVIQKLPSNSFFSWMKEGMNERYLERDVIAGWVETHYVDPSEGTLVEHMIRWGKVLSLTEAAYPKFDPSIILRYSVEDYQWALDNEYQYWKYLVKQKLLFKTNDRTTNNMISEGPFTAGLPDQDSPDRLGQFLGYRMVKNYMNNCEITVEEMLEVSYNDILQAFKIEQ